MLVDLTLLDMAPGVRALVFDFEGALSLEEIVPAPNHRRLLGHRAFATLRTVPAARPGGLGRPVVWAVGMVVDPRLGHQAGADDPMAALPAPRPARSRRALADLAGTEVRGLA